MIESYIEHAKEYPYFLIPLSVILIIILAIYNLKNKEKALEENNLLGLQAYLYTWVVIIILVLILFSIY